MIDLVTEIVGTVVVDGVSRLLERFVDEVGNIFWRTFADEDGDGIPDDYENPIDIWEQEPDEWFPFLSGDDNEHTEQTVENVIVITPNGPAIMFANPDSEDYESIVHTANEQWLELYGATTKEFGVYSVSEALLFIIAACTLFSFFCKVFKRRKF